MKKFIKIIMLRSFLLMLILFIIKTNFCFAQEMTDNQRFLSGFSSGESPELDNNPRYQREEVMVNVPGYGLQKEVRYIDKQNSATWEEKYGNDWGNLKKKNMVLYYFLEFFNPPFLNNFIFTILTVMIAVGTLFTFGFLEGDFKLFMIVLSIYCWGRILSFFVLTSLVGKGILSP